MDDRGIIYFLQGSNFNERSAVALWTLRKHYNGPVTVFYTEEKSQLMAERLASDSRLRVEITKTEKADVRRNSCYVTKTMLPARSPYRRSLLIDADTVICGSLDPLFEPRLAVTRFGEWVTTGRIMSKRIHGFDGISPNIDAMVAETQEKPWPAVNTGIVGWHQESGNLPAEMIAWHYLTQQKAGHFIADETAMNLLVPQIPEECIFDDRYNCSPIYGANTDKVVIWHFHGDKHLRRDPGKEIWWPAFMEAHDANAAGLQDWAGAYDKGVKGMLAETSQG